MARKDSDRRKKILEAAVITFAEHGLDGTTIRTVGKAAHVNSALIYYYFEDKRTLFSECIILTIHGLLMHLQKRLPSFSGPRDRIAFLVESLGSYFGAHPERIRLILLAISKHPDLFGEALVSFIRNNEQLTPLMVLKEGIEKGELKPMPLVNMWWMIIGSAIFTFHVSGIIKNIDIGRVPKPVTDTAQMIKLMTETLSDGLVDKTTATQESK